ncbi:MAG TPA: hypothetical protein VFW23_08510, partial [Tepidisphaeraceae bacterium]|nr:hypothetical protein [Tepidisphaeraceae bacterium]
MINKKKTPRLAASGSVLRRPSVESMESRRLLSASPTFMAGRFWDFAPAQYPVVHFAGLGPSYDVRPGAASPDFLRPSIQPNRFEPRWNTNNQISDSFGGRTDSNDWQGSSQFMNSGFVPVVWQGAPTLIFDVPTAMPQFGGATEVLYTISITGPFSTGSFQETTILMATSFHGSPAGMFDSSGLAPGGSYHDGRADRAEMLEPGDYAPPATPAVYPVPPANVSTAPAASDASSAPAARPGLLHSQPSTAGQANGSAMVTSANSVGKISHPGTSQVPAVSAVTSASAFDSTAAAIASVAPRMLMQESAAILHTADEVVRVVGGTLATTGASAATTTVAVPQVVNEAKSFAAAAPIVMQETAALAQAVVHVNPIDAVATFSDALAAFARDCAGIGTAKVDAPDPRRAWAITGAVLAADAILI